MCCNKGPNRRASLEFRKIDEVDEDFKELIKKFEKQYGSFSPQNRTST